MNAVNPCRAYLIIYPERADSCQASVSVLASSCSKDTDSPLSGAYSHVQREGWACSSGILDVGLRRWDVLSRYSARAAPQTEKCGILPFQTLGVQER